MSRMAMTGMGLLAMSLWVFRAVLTEDRPGRRLLGDALYAFFPLQPSECVVMGTGLGLFGFAITGLSPTGRRLFSAILRGGAGMAAGVSQPDKPTVKAQPTTGSERLTASAVTSHHEPLAVRPPTPGDSAASGTGADHHGI